MNPPQTITIIINPLGLEPLGRKFPDEKVAIVKVFVTGIANSHSLGKLLILLRPRPHHLANWMIFVTTLSQLNLSAVNLQIKREIVSKLDSGYQEWESWVKSISSVQFIDRPWWRFPGKMFLCYLCLYAAAGLENFSSCIYEKHDYKMHGWTWWNSHSFFIYLLRFVILYSFVWCHIVMLCLMGLICHHDNETRSVENRRNIK